MKLGRLLNSLLKTHLFKLCFAKGSFSSSLLYYFNLPNLTFQNLWFVNVSLEACSPEARSMGPRSRWLPYYTFIVLLVWRRPDSRNAIPCRRSPQQIYALLLVLELMSVGFWLVDHFKPPLAKTIKQILCVWFLCIQTVFRTWTLFMHMTICGLLNNFYWWSKQIYSLSEKSSNMQCH